MSVEWFIEWRTGAQSRRVEVEGVMTVGRSAACDVTIDDRFASRVHCTVEAQGDYLLVDASNSLNHIDVNGVRVETAALKGGDTFVVGTTSLRAVHARDERTEKLESAAQRPTFILRRSTRELVGPGGQPILQFSPLECSAFEALAALYPNAASHDVLGAQVWQGTGFDQYQLHRLMQRVRQRLGEHAELVENVRGAGYRLRQPVIVG